MIVTEVSLILLHQSRNLIPLELRLLLCHVISTLEPLLIFHHLLSQGRLHLYLVPLTFGCFVILSFLLPPSLGLGNLKKSQVFLFLCFFRFILGYNLLIKTFVDYTALVLTVAQVLVH